MQISNVIAKNEATEGVVLSIFTGAGLLDLGFEQNGFCVSKFKSKMTKAKDLKKGEQFKLVGQRKYRTFKNSTTLENSPIIHHRDKLLIVTDDCKHFFALPDDEVQVKTC